LQVRCTGPVCGYLDSYRAVCNAGWRRPIGCFKLQVIFRKRAINYRALLRKMTYKDKASYGSSPPCTSCSTFANQMNCGFTGFLWVVASHNWSLVYIHMSRIYMCTECVSEVPQKHILHLCPGLLSQETRVVPQKHILYTYKRVTYKWKQQSSETHSEYT